MLWLRLIILLLLLVGGSLSAQAEVGASSPVVNPAGPVRLLSAVTATGDLTEIRLGVEFQLRDGWKIYWRTPGDAGYPPELHWDGSKNLAAAEILWPAPKRFVLGDLQNYGYSGTVVLPVVATVKETEDPLLLRLRVDYLACEHICVPMTANLALDIPGGLAYPTGFAHRIEQSMARVPDDNPARGLTVERVEVVDGGGETPSLRVMVHGAVPLDAPDVFVEPDTVALFGAPQVEQQGNQAVITLPVVAGTLKRGLTDGPLTLTATDGDLSFTTSIIPVPTMKDATPWLLMLGLALLGGFILNLMPCVLPVLSLKIVGVVHYGGAERGHIRAAFLASALGILVSFLVLAATAVVLKTAGAAVGWGIQFQNPWFLAVMVVLLLFALNLWGWFEIPLPHWLARSATSERLPRHTLAGHFLSGAFATLLATPCSAPFLGTAVGFALARGPLEIVAIFAALGLGMSIPYLLVAVWPQAAQVLPKPGPWTVTLKKVLAVALLGTAVWLGSILGTIVWGHYDNGRSDSPATEVWQPFDLAAIPLLVAEGKRVFVDVTADWCITCKINKAVVLDSNAVKQLLDAPDVVRMRADWTSPDPAISHYMAEFGRYGIPFNAVYGPQAPQGIVLPELLSEQAVADALAQAAASP